MTEAAAQQSLPARALLEAQGEILDMMAEDAPLRDTLTRIAEQVEALAPQALCSILLMQADGRHLRPAAAPSLPETYCAAIDQNWNRAQCQLCGTASFRKEPVIVTDIATDPLWAGPRDFTLSFRASGLLVAADPRQRGRGARYHCALLSRTARAVRSRLGPLGAKRQARASGARHPSQGRRGVVRQ